MGAQRQQLGHDQARDGTSLAAGATLFLPARRHCHQALRKTVQSGTMAEARWRRRLNDRLILIEVAGHLIA